MKNLVINIGALILALIIMICPVAFGALIASDIYNALSYILMIITIIELVVVKEIIVFHCDIKSFFGI